MEPVCYTVQTINGDYAYLLSDSGVENQVAMFLLPEGHGRGQPPPVGELPVDAAVGARPRAVRRRRGVRYAEADH